MDLRTRILKRSEFFNLKKLNWWIKILLKELTIKILAVERGREGRQTEIWRGGGERVLVQHKLIQMFESLVYLHFYELFYYNIYSLQYFFFFAEENY